MPPLLWACLAATPVTNSDGSACLGGLRDRALLLVGFIGALRRSELCNVDVEHLERHDKGLVLHIPRSKTNQTGEQDQLVVLPRASDAAHCPVRAVEAWRLLARIDSGPLLRGLTRNNLPRPTRMHHESVTKLVKAAVERAGTDPADYSAHSLRAGFVTWASLRGQSDRSIARQTRHQSLQSISPYVRIKDIWEANAATEIL